MWMQYSFLQIRFLLVEKKNGGGVGGEKGPCGPAEFWLFPGYIWSFLCDVLNGSYATSKPDPHSFRNQFVFHSTTWYDRQDQA